MNNTKLWYRWLVPRGAYLDLPTLSEGFNDYLFMRHWIRLLLVVLLILSGLALILPAHTIAWPLPTAVLLHLGVAIYVGSVLRRKLDYTAKVYRLLGRTGMPRCVVDE